MLKQAVHKIGRSYIQHLVASEAQRQSLRQINERPLELIFLFETIRDVQPVRVLDVGSGQSPLPALMRNCGAHVTAVDNVRDYWPSGMVNRHWEVIDDDIREPRRLKSGFDLVVCISVIEHIREHEKAFRSMAGLLAPGGHLLITCPYNERRYVDDAYKLPEATIDEEQPYHCSMYDRAVIDRWKSAASVEIVREKFWQLWDGEVWRQGDSCQHRAKL
jgi:SAM-dependent methyltransferase